jgi:hypothetical protein
MSNPPTKARLRARRDSSAACCLAMPARMACCLAACCLAMPARMACCFAAWRCRAIAAADGPAGAAVTAAGSAAAAGCSWRSAPENEANARVGCENEVSAPSASAAATSRLLALLRLVMLRPMIVSLCLPRAHPRRADTVASPRSAGCYAGNTGSAVCDVPHSCAFRRVRIAGTFTDRSE